MANMLNRTKKLLKKLADRAAASPMGKVVVKIPAPIRKGYLAGLMVPVPGAGETGAAIGAGIWAKRALEGAVRKRTGQPYRMFAAGAETPARRILGDQFPEGSRVIELQSPETRGQRPDGRGDPYARVGRYREDEELARDRRALKRIAIGGLAAGGVVATIIHKGRAAKAAPPAPLGAIPFAGGAKKAAKVAKVVKPVPRAWPKLIHTPKVPKVKKVAAPSGFFTKAARRARTALEVKETRGQRPEARGKNSRLIDFGDAPPRDKLSRARDVAIIGGTGAVGAGAVMTAYQARKLGKKAGDALGYASSGVARTAKQVRETVTPETVAREGMKLVKRKAKQKAVEYFPTFSKWGGTVGRAIKKNLSDRSDLFMTPARRIIDFAAPALRDVNTDRFADHWKTASGAQQSYEPDPKNKGQKTPVDLPMGDFRVVKSAYRHAGEINKWGGRGVKVVRDASDVVRGVPRQRDGSGRKKKREWEKSWAQEHAKKALIGGGILAYGVGMKRHKGFRDWNIKAARAVKDTVNDYVPNTFETPARRMGVQFLAAGSGKREAESGKRVPGLAAGVRGAMVGGVAGGYWGAASAAGSKHADGYYDIRGKHAQKRVHDALNAYGPDAAARRLVPARPFTLGKAGFGLREKFARAEHEALAKLKKTAGRRALGGGLAGAALLGGASYAAAKAAGGQKPEARDQKPGKKKNFATPAQRMGLIELGGKLDADTFKAVWRHHYKKARKMMRGGKLSGELDGYLPGDRMASKSGLLWRGTGKKEIEQLAETGRFKSKWTNDNFPKRQRTYVAGGPQKTVHYAQTAAAYDGDRGGLQGARGHFGGSKNLKDTLADARIYGIAPKALKRADNRVRGFVGDYAATAPLRGGVGAREVRVLLKTDGTRKVPGYGGAIHEEARWKPVPLGDIQKKNFSTPAQRMGVISFDEVAADAGWDVRDPRGRSARVFAPGSRKRVRREKSWAEEVGNERALWKAGIAGAGLAAGVAGLAVGRHWPKGPIEGGASVKVPVMRGGGLKDSGLLMKIVKRKRGG